MWIVLNDAFLSVVSKRGSETHLLVRARVRGDIEKIFCDAEVFEDGSADYKYRSYIDRDTVSKVIGDSISKIEYDNFKNSVSKDDHKRLQAYTNVWGALYELQN